MADSCANCYFYRIAPASAGPLAGAFHCRNDAPRQTGEDFPWAPVHADWWCGDGKDVLTQRPFSPKAYSPSTPSSAGSFSMVAAATVNKVDAACTTASVVQYWVTAGTPPNLRFVVNAGSFDAFTDDGSNTTATWGYLLY